MCALLPPWSTAIDAGRRRLAWAALTLVVASATPGAATASSSLVDEYVGLGWRLSDQPTTPDVKLRPLAFPTRGSAADYPLRRPTAVRVVRGGAIIVDEAMTGRVLRVGTDGRLSVLAGRRTDGNPWCASTPSAGGGRIWADRHDNKVVRSGADGISTTLAGTGRTGFAGDGGPATAARLNHPTCAVPVADGSILIADQGNNRVRRIGADGIITTVAGNGEALFSGEGGPATAAGLVPQEVIALPDGGALVTDPRNARVLRIRPDGTLSTFAGTGIPGYDGDGGPARSARLSVPWGLARGADGSVVVGDFGSQTVRRISPSGVITTVLGAPPQRVATRSRALTAWVPARRVVSHWIEPAAGVTSFGERGTSDESAAGRHAVIRGQGYAGTTNQVTVVHGETSLTWSNMGDFGCWIKYPTGIGLSGNPVQARDLQAGAGAPSPYAPGPGPYAPDLARGGLILARAPIALDSTPQFGTAGWETAWRAQRLVEYVIHRRSGRVVAVQAWSLLGYQRQYRIRPVPRSKHLRFPSTRPREYMVARGATGTQFRCGPPGRAAQTVPSVYGFRDGMDLARRVTRRLEKVPAIRVHAVGRSRVGRHFSATSALRLERGRVREGITQVVAPGRPQPNLYPPGGSYTALTTGTGEALIRSKGSSCWTRAGVVPEEQQPAPLGQLLRVMPLDDAFFERPRLNGRLIVLRVHSDGMRVDSLIDPRDMRLVAQRWLSGGGDRGVIRFIEVGSVPPLPASTPRCPVDENR